MSVDMSKSTTVKGKASFSLRSGHNVSFGCHRAITDITRSILNMNYNLNSNTIIFKLGFERKNVKIVLPVVLSHECSYRAFSLSFLYFGIFVSLFENFILGPLSEYETFK